MLKKILIGLGILLVIIQFIRPDKNESNDLTNEISTKYEVPAAVNDILQVSCNDCHSNFFMEQLVSIIKYHSKGSFFLVNDEKLKKSLCLSKF